MIRFFAAHPTAANLLMMLLLALGAVTVPTIVRSTFPPLPLKIVEVEVLFPGAAPDRVEEAVCRRLEDAADRVDQVRETRCEARENLGIARIEAVEGAAIDRFLADVRGEVDAIVDFPASVERVVVRLLGTIEPVVSIAAFGDLPYPVLRDYALDLQQRLQRLPGVSQVRIDGFTDRQLRVDLDPLALRGLGLSVTDVANAVRLQNLELPAGDVETRDGALMLRIAAEGTTPEALDALVIRGTASGGEVRLGEIARIVDTFEYPNQRMTFDGKPAAFLVVQKSRDGDALDVLAEVEAFVDRERVRHPEIGLEFTADVASLVKDRLGMLVRNGLQGLVLVMLVLWLFFSGPHAFWVVMGLPVSFAGTFGMMALFGYQFDMMTLVALLVAIGILVDDSIVVSENIAVQRARGKDPLTASVDGVREVLPAVFASFITTVCVFGPLAFLSGDLGSILKVVPIILLMTLSVSFVEVFLILPSHLTHVREAAPARIQQAMDRGLDRLRDYVVQVWVVRFVRWRYAGFGLLIALLLGSVSLVASGVLGFTPLPELDNESIEARIQMPAGTPPERTAAVVQHVLAALEELNAELTPRQPGGAALVRHVAVRYGSNIDALESGDHLATIAVDLLGPEVRSHTSTRIRNLWRERVGVVPDVNLIRFADPMIGPQGRALELRVSGTDLDTLRRAATELLEELRTYRGVHDPSIDLRPGKPELRLRPRPGAEALGVTATRLAEQLRGAFFGVRAAEVQVGSERFEIHLRLDPEARRDLDTLDGFMVRTASGMVPLGTVAELEETSGYTRIQRIDGRRVVTVDGLIDQQQTTSGAVVQGLVRDFLPGWQARYPDLGFTLAGESDEAADTLGSIRRGFLLGMLGIFALLAFLFRSYIEPLVVIAIIPLAFIGVVAGHLLLGYNLTMPSILGLVSLAGIAVNNSILLVIFVESRLQAGMPLADAVIRACHDRFRPILLTSVTTVAGLLPLLLETSMQAKVVIPLAISLAFGLATATALVLFVIPAFYLVLQDFGLFRRYATGAGAPVAGAGAPGAR